MKTILPIFLFFTFFDGFSQSIYIRRNVKSLTQAEINEFTAAIVAMKQRTSQFNATLSAYDYFVQIHWEALNPTHQQEMMYGHYAHGNPGFLTWHRELVRRFEVELRISTGKPNYTLPYWDWTDRSYDSYIFSANFMGSNGVPNSNQTYKYEVLDGPFGRNNNNFPISIQTSYDNPLVPSRQYLQRKFGGSIANTLPTAADVTNALNVGTYDTYPWNTRVNENQSFRQYFEGFRYNSNVAGSDTIANELHGRVHIYVDGHLLSDASPNDPLFFMNHANVDRIFAQWQDKWGINNFPQTWQDTAHQINKTWNDVMYPFTATHKSMLDVRLLGYIYDTQSLSVKLNMTNKGIAINKTGELPHASAVLDVKHDSLGILIPRITKASRPTSPATGLLIFQVDNTSGFYYFDGLAWQRLSNTASNIMQETPAQYDEDSGSGNLENGITIVKFNQPRDDFDSLIINIQPEGDCNGLYIANKTREGFEVKELQKGLSNIKFTWSIR